MSHTRQEMLNFFWSTWFYLMSRVHFSSLNLFKCYLLHSIVIMFRLFKPWICAAYNQPVIESVPAMNLSGGFVIAVLLCGAAQAYPDGAPVTTAACEDMFPSGHMADPQNTQPPYTLSWALDENNYNVTLSAEGGNVFRGLLVQARYENDFVAWGRFINEPIDVWKPIDCQNGNGTAATHRSREDKTSVVITWAPEGVTDLTGLRFVATVVQERQVFWQNIQSAVLA